ncbi:MAG: PDZ domain-containing protein, partial [Alphaproteobacteria bacterium]
SATSLSDFGLALVPSDDGVGVTVRDVDPSSQAAERGIQPGDVILMVGGTEVATVGDIEALIDAAREEGLRAVLFRIQSRDRTRFVPMTLARS